MLRIFQFDDAKAGRYSIVVSLTGFEQLTTDGLVLAARQQLNVDAKLAVGSVQQKVSVSAEAIDAINTGSELDETYSGFDGSHRTQYPERIAHNRNRTVIQFTCVYETLIL